MRQMRELVADTPRVAPPHDAVVYAGDMNDWRHRLYPQVLSGAGFRCAVGDDDDPGHATYPSWMPIGALDKVFVKGSMADLAATLNSFVDRIVVDQTELAGLYDFKLNFSDLAGNSSASLYGAIEASIPSALQSLGLKLEPQTATVEFVVIDEIARVRTAN